MLRIVCCYVPGQLRDETRSALRAFAPIFVPIAYVQLEPNDLNHYGAALRFFWQQSHDEGVAMAIVEPDIVVRPDVIDAFLGSPHPYVCFPYAWTTNVGPALGCTRFSAGFIQRYPTLMDEAVATGVGWQQLDVVIMRRLLAQKYGEQPLVLLPPVEHLNEAKRLLPDADPTPLMRVPDIDEIGNLA